MENFFESYQYSIQAISSIVTVIAVITSLLTSYFVYNKKRKIIKVNSIKTLKGHSTEKKTYKELLLNIENLLEHDIIIYKIDLDFKDKCPYIGCNEIIKPFNVKEVSLSLDINSYNINKIFNHNYKLIFYTNFGPVKHKINREDFKEIKSLLEFNL